MAKRKKKQQAKGYKPPSLSEIFEPLVDGWQNIGDSLVFDPNSLDDFGEYMTIKDAKKFREEYGDPTDVQGSGRKGNISKKYEITPSKSKIEESQNDLTTQAVNREEEEVGLSGVSSQDIYSSNTPSLYQQPLTDTEIFNNQNYLINQNAAIANQTVSESGGQEYTTSYQEAIKNSNKTQAWEDTIDSETPLEKSNVFTIDPDTGMPLGVMTRSQRRTWDEANARKKESLKATMDDTGRSASDIKAIHSKKGLETVIDGNNPVDRKNIEIETPPSATQDNSNVGSDVFTGNTDNMGYNDNPLQGIGSIFRPKVG